MTYLFISFKFINTTIYSEVTFIMKCSDTMVVLLASIFLSWGLQGLQLGSAGEVQEQGDEGRSPGKGRRGEKLIQAFCLTEPNAGSGTC